MNGDSVVYVHDITCPSCGNRSSGYMQATPDGKGMTICRKCGATFTQPLPPHYVAQIAPEDFVSPIHPSVRVSHYPGLYTQPKRPPRFDFSDLIRIAYSPTKAFTNLYLSTNIHRAMAIVLVFSMLSIGISTVVTSEMAAVLGYDVNDALNFAFQSTAGWILLLFAFLLLGMVTSAIAKSIFGGRGETGMTITLLGYCFPLYVLLSAIVLIIFSVGFEGLDLTNVEGWTQSQIDQAVAWGSVLLLVGVIGLGWILRVAARAVSVANDISTSEGVLSLILGGVVAGIIYLVAGAVMQLPLGLSL